MAFILGELFSQLKLPSVAGELAAGLLICPTFLNIVKISPEAQALSSIALFFIIFFDRFSNES